MAESGTYRDGYYGTPESDNRLGISDIQPVLRPLRFFVARLRQGTGDTRPDLSRARSDP